MKLSKILLLIILGLALLASPQVLARSEMELLTGLGYRDTLSTPFVRLGASIKAVGRNGDVGIHFSNVLCPQKGESTVTVGVEAGFMHVAPPATFFSLRASAFMRQRADITGRTISLEGKGNIGSFKGNFAIGYIERKVATFPWENEDAINGVLEDTPYYYIQLGTAAMVASQWGLRWSQDVTFRRHLDESSYRLGLVTGPQIALGPGYITLLGGVVLGANNIRPMGELRFAVVDPYEETTELRISVATTSLRRDVPVYQAMYSLNTTGGRFQALLRLEHPINGTATNPTIYLAIQPKF
jgi:hypothetical protein